MIQERLSALRLEMNKEGIQAYIIPTSDFHETEYVCEYFACRKYMSGFTGSAGTLVVTLESAALWTDGRYFIQATDQLKGSTIELMKMGLEDTPSISEYILEHMKAGGVVGFDGRSMNTKEARSYQSFFEKHNISLDTSLDLVGRIWTDRPSMPATQTYLYDTKYAGYSMADKLNQVRQKMEEVKTNSFVITKIDEVAWLFNLRADDIPYYPVALAYAIIEKEKATLYIDSSRLDDVSKKELDTNHVEVKGYDDIYQEVSSIQGPVWIDPSSLNIRLYELIQEEVVETQSPIVLMKSIKNETEIKNTKIAHLRDGVAVTRFMYWLEHEVGNSEQSELSVQDKLHEFRSEQEDFLEESFATITAYKKHGAIIHYQSSEESNVALEKSGMLMIDSGGQYLQGTTDITRTFVLGDISEEERRFFTLVLRGHIQLEMAHWLYGCRGLNLDILARGPLWKECADYQHGTGHGVGHLSSVHEAPIGIRWKIVPERMDSCVIEPGMITSDEPGYYQEDGFGIRHENELLAVKGQKNGYGQFMHFECLTLVPFDVKGLDISIMQEEEIAWLNEYHQRVYDEVGPYLKAEEKEWLKEVCQPIHK